MGDWKYITNEVAENTIMKSVKTALERDEFDILHGGRFWWTERGWINDRLKSPGNCTAPDGATSSLTLLRRWR